MALALSAGAATIGTASLAAVAPTLFSPADAAPALEGADHRMAPAQLKASDRLKEALIEEEGVRYTVYHDVAGNPTVGVGHLVTPQDGLRVGDRISPERALQLLDADLKVAEFGARQVLGDLPVLQHEFDALVDLVFNVGAGTLDRENSPRLTHAIATGDYRAIAAELGYHHAGGVEAGGLIHRSERRANIFLAAAYDDPREVGTALA